MFRSYVKLCVLIQTKTPATFPITMETRAPRPMTLKRTATVASAQNALGALLKRKIAWRGRRVMPKPIVSVMQLSLFTTFDSILNSDLFFYANSDGDWGSCCWEEPEEGLRRRHWGSGRCPQQRRFRRGCRGVSVDEEEENKFATSQHSFYSHLPPSLNVSPFFFSFYFAIRLSTKDRKEIFCADEG